MTRHPQASARAHAVIIKPTAVAKKYRADLLRFEAPPEGGGAKMAHLSRGEAGLLRGAKGAGISRIWSFNDSGPVRARRRRRRVRSQKTAI